MSKKKDTVVYTLRKDRKIVYIGETNDLDRRLEEHKRDRKRFDTVSASKPMTKTQAEKEEARRLETYRKNQGRDPKYND